MSNRLRRIMALTCAALLLSTSAFTSSAAAQTMSQGDAANAPAAETSKPLVATVNMQKKATLLLNEPSLKPEWKMIISGPARPSIM